MAVGKAIEEVERIMANIGWTWTKNLLGDFLKINIAHPIPLFHFIIVLCPLLFYVSISVNGGEVYTIINGLFLNEVRSLHICLF